MRIFACMASWRQVANTAGKGPRCSRCANPAVSRTDRSSTPSFVAPSSAPVLHNRP